MIEKTHSVFSYVIILLGIVHIFFVFPIENFDTGTLYFIGSGIAIIFAGLINLISIKSSAKLILGIAIATNFIMMFLFSITLFALKEPQVYFGILLFGIAFFLSLRKVLG